MEDATFILEWTCDAPSPYNSELFSEISKDSRFELCVHYRFGHLNSHPWKESFGEGHRFNIGNTTFGIDFGLLRRIHRKRRQSRDQLRVVLGGWSSMTSLILAVYLRWTRSFYLVWADTPQDDTAKPWAKRHVRRLLLKSLLRRANCVLGTGRLACEELVRLGADPHRTMNFPYWVDPTKYPGERPVTISKQEPLNVLIVGRLELESKGQDLALEALQAFQLKTGREVHVKVIGDGSDFAVLEQLTSRMTNVQVSMPGWLDRVDLKRELESAQILIHAAPRREPYGVVVIEAMAGGLVVFASDQTMSALDRIESGRNGMIHSAGNVAMLTEQLCEVLSDSKRFKLMRQASLRTALDWPIVQSREILNRALRLS